MTQEDLNQLAKKYTNTQGRGLREFETMMSNMAYKAGFNKALELVLEKCHVRDGNTLLTCLDMEDILDSL